jgi:hypothetical protein
LIAGEAHTSDMPERARRDTIELVKLIADLWLKRAKTYFVIQSYNTTQVQFSKCSRIQMSFAVKNT